MLLTITTTHRPATDLGYLLHKNPGRFQSYDLSFGQAHVYYPEAGDDRYAACLLLDAQSFAASLFPTGLRFAPEAAAALEAYVDTVHARLGAGHPQLVALTSRWQEHKTNAGRGEAEASTAA